MCFNEQKNFNAECAELINISYTAIYIVIALGLKVVLEAFLNTRKFHDLLNIFIGLTTATTALTIVSAVVPEAKQPLSLILIIAGLGINVMYIIPFFKTRKTENALQPLWGKFSIVNIVVALLFFTIVLMPLALILNIASSIFGAMVFSRAAKLYDTVGGTRLI